MCRNIEKTFRINKNRRLGKVLIIVEGRAELDCFRQIFNKLFGYEVLRMNRNAQCNMFRSERNGTLVVIANAKTSNIKSVLDDVERERIVIAAQRETKELFRNYRIYYVWDRDEGSNAVDNVKKAIKKLGDPQMNDEIYEGGLLLLSYPCYESYLISNFEKQDYIGMHPKRYLKGLRKRKISHKKINESTLLKAFGDFVKKYDNLRLDVNSEDYKYQSIKLFRKEEELLKHKREYLLLSQISLLLFDLGLIEVVESEEQTK